MRPVPTGVGSGSHHDTNRVVGEVRAGAGGVRHPDDAAEHCRASGKDGRRDGKVYDVPRLCTSQTTSKFKCPRHNGSPNTMKPLRKNCSGSVCSLCLESANPDVSTTLVAPICFWFQRTVWS
jgi:hypothetical protein